MAFTFEGGSETRPSESASCSGDASAGGRLKSTSLHRICYVPQQVSAKAKQPLPSSQPTDSEILSGTGQKSMKMHCLRSSNSSPHSPYYVTIAHRQSSPFKQMRLTSDLVLRYSNMVSQSRLPVGPCLMQKLDMFKLRKNFWLYSSGSRSSTSILTAEGESEHRPQPIRSYCQEGFSSSSKTLAEDAAADAAIRGGYSI